MMMYLVSAVIDSQSTKDRYKVKLDKMQIKSVFRIIN